MVRGIDTQMLTVKPADFTAGQSRIQKMDDLHLQQHLSQNVKDTEFNKERTVAANKSEGRKIGEDDKDRGGGDAKKRKKRPPAQETAPRSGPAEPRIDPMLLLPVERGRYARRDVHIIDLQL